jgi:hypothetical protein
MTWLHYMSFRNTFCGKASEDTSKGGRTRLDTLPGWKHFSSPVLSCRFWGPDSLLSNWFWGFYSWLKRLKRDAEKSFTSRRGRERRNTLWIRGNCNEYMEPYFHSPVLRHALKHKANFISCLPGLLKIKYMCNNIIFNKLTLVQKVLQETYQMQ